MEITVKNISKSFGSKKVLNNISLHVNSGEILCLLGPSGAGKTTLIRSMIGATKIDQGEICYDDIRVPNRELMYHIGFMPQADSLYPDLTGLENMNFFGGLFHIKNEELKNRIDELLTTMGLFEDRNKYVCDYSGGMKKRLSLAITLLHQPDVLMLDEPTVGIDPVLRKTIWDTFEALKNNGTTIIVSTHVMDEATKCKRCALLYDGDLIYDDLTETLLAKTKTGNIEDLFFMVKEAKSYV